MGTPYFGAALPEPGPRSPPLADATGPLALPPLDGVVCANTLHFHRHKEPILTLVRGYLRPAGGRLLVVEYNIDSSDWNVRSYELPS